jgi:hypothetical protein
MSAPLVLFAMEEGGAEGAESQAVEVTKTEVMASAAKILRFTGRLPRMAVGTGGPDMRAGSRRPFRGFEVGGFECPRVRRPGFPGASKGFQRGQRIAPGGVGPPKLGCHPLQVAKRAPALLFVQHGERRPQALPLAG